MSICDNGVTILMRHGHTDYKQGNVPVSIEDANDLNAEGIEAVSASAREIAAILQNSEQITIYTSPMGRAIHTAIIIKVHLEVLGRKVDLVPAMELQEVHHFQWSLFHEAVLASGLEVAEEHTDKWFALNPFREKTPELLGRLPEHLRDFVKKVENVDEAGKRLLDFVGSKADEPGDKIYVSHDGLLCGLLKELSGDQLFTCTRSHYFEIIPAGNSLGMQIGHNNLGYIPRDPETLRQGLPLK